MARPVAIFFILLLAAVHILALPGGPEAPKKETAKQPPTNYNATWECNFKYKVLWDDYKLTGRDWGVNETVLLKQVNKAGIASKWRYKKWEKDGHEGFVSTFRLPLASSSRVTVYSNQLLHINPLMKDEEGYILKGVECFHGDVNAWD